MALTTLTAQELFEELSDLARDEGVNDQTAWDDLVEEVIESHMSLGEIDVDDDIEGLKEILKAKWKEYKLESIKEELGQEEDMDNFDKKGNDDDGGLGQTKEDE